MLARERTEQVDTSSQVTGGTSKGNNKPYFSQNKGDSEYRSHPVSSAEALVASSEKSKDYRDKCRYCERHHWSDMCPTYRTISQKKKKLKGCCYKCLKVGHKSTECRCGKRCVHYGETDVHHWSMCPK